MEEMTQPTSRTSNSDVIIPNWKNAVKGEDDPSNREIIAFELGKEAHKEELLNLFNTNLQISCLFSEKYFQFLTKEKNISCELATVTPYSFNSFQSKFVIKFSDYTNKELRTELYKQATEIRKSLKQ